MKVFIYEHITSGALVGQPLPDSLANEGDMMLLTTLQDCHEIGQLQLITLRDNRLAVPPFFTEHLEHKCHSVHSYDDYQKHWSQTLTECDVVLIIAPETEQCLAKLQQHAHDANKRYLGCTPEAIKLTSNKLLCHQQLTSSGLLSPKTTLASDWQKKSFKSQFGYISKPLDGAGCIETLFWQNKIELDAFISTVAEPHHTLIQQYIPGETLSLSVLFSEHQTCLLSINQQHLKSENNELSLNACTINNLDNISISVEQASNLAKHIKNAIPELLGFVGVDIISNNNGLYILDINPRLTTSFCGLKASLNLNPMQLLFDSLDNPNLPITVIDNPKTIKISL